MMEREQEDSTETVREKNALVADEAKIHSEMNKFHSFNRLFNQLLVRRALLRESR